LNIQHFDLDVARLLLSRIGPPFPRSREGRAFKKSREVIGVSRYHGRWKVPVLGRFVRSERRYI
jgi:hypothetical protein